MTFALLSGRKATRRTYRGQCNIKRSKENNGALDQVIVGFLGADAVAD
jgi:hypothetical protein